MLNARKPKLDMRTRYLQVALNSTLRDAQAVIRSLPRDDRIIIEVGTPLIKEYGADAIREISQSYRAHVMGSSIFSPQHFEVTKNMPVGEVFSQITQTESRDISSNSDKPTQPYIVADMKMMDRGEREVLIAKDAGASAITALGHAPIESLNAFIEACEEHGLDAHIDMMNVDFPVGILRQLKRQPQVVILHRGVDEEARGDDVMLPLHEIRRLKGEYDIAVAVAGGDTSREIQSAAFNDANIVVVWKNFYRADDSVGELATQFLKEIK